MKIVELKHTSSHSSNYPEQPFYKNNGINAFFSDRQTDIQTKPFFSKQATIPFNQPKTTIGRPGDKYGQEADAVAQKVVSSSPPAFQSRCSDCVEKEKLLAHELTLELQQSGNNLIQRQEQTEVTPVRDVLSPDPGSGGGATRASRCYTDPDIQGIHTGVGITGHF